MPVLTTAGATLIVAGITAALSIAGSMIKNGRLKEARELIRGLPIPAVEKFMYEAELLNDPEKFIARVQQRSEMAQITEDPRLKQSQMGALQGLQDIQEGGGYTTAERGQIEQTMQGALTKQRGAEQAGLQRAQSRGMGGSGLQMASDLARGQGGISAASQAGFNIAQGGQQRALQAMQSGGQLGGQIRGQEWGQSADVASAQDAINRANIGAENQGQQFNISAAMDTAKANQDAINAKRRADVQAEKDLALMEIDKRKALAETYK